MTVVCISDYYDYYCWGIFFWKQNKMNTRAIPKIINSESRVTHMSLFCFFIIVCVVKT